jgi:hypothetical protein
MTASTASAAIVKRERGAKGSAPEYGSPKVSIADAMPIFPAVALAGDKKRDNLIGRSSGRRQRRCGLEAMEVLYGHGG